MTIHKKKLFFRKFIEYMFDYVLSQSGGGESI